MKVKVFIFNMNLGYYSTYKRRESVKEYVKNYIYKNNLGDDEKVVIISHNSFLKMLIADVDEKQVCEDMPNPFNKYEFSNCKFYSFDD